MIDLLLAVSLVWSAGVCLGFGLGAGWALRNLK